MIVAAMGTDAWSGARDQAAELFRQADPEDRHTGLRRQLDAHAAVVDRNPDPDRARALLVGAWQVQLETLLDLHPHIIEQLRTLIDRVDAALPAAGRRFVQNNTAHDHGVVNAVQYGTQHIHYMDSTRPRPPAALAPEESDI